MSFKLKLQVGSLPSNRLASTNKIYVSNEMIQNIGQFYSGHNVPPLGNSQAYLVMANGHPYAVEGHPQVPNDQVAFNGLQRRFAQLSLAAPVVIQPLQPYPPAPLAAVEIAVDTLAKSKSSSGNPKAKPKEIDSDRLAQTVLLVLQDQVLEVGNMAAIDFEGTKLEIKIKSLQSLADLKKSKKSKSKDKDAPPPQSRLGQSLQPTNILFTRAEGCTSIVLTGDHVAEGGGGGAPNIFLNDFDFEKLGIGGLDSEFNQIFRRAFSSRIWPANIIKQMGINHVRGMLLYGPPGCGKTLIARQIGKALNSREPKIVNGPEILNKFVGGSEEKIRELFKEAEQEQLEMGDSSMLHIIVMDEMDAICKQRGTVKDGTGVSDSVVNQLLSKIDGVDSLNNILLIGMTNRKDMIDDALLRPGRLEVHVEIGLPDEKGRLQILNIHTKNMREAKRIAPDVSGRFPELAEKTKNFSGAEIEGLVKAASSYALGNLAGAGSGDGSDNSNLLAPTGDARREVLNVLMAKGKQGDTIAAGTADSVQRSLQELERKRATELLMSGSYNEASHKATEEEGTATYNEIECTRQKLVSLGFGALNPNNPESDEGARATTEEDEVMEAIRLLLIQNRVAQGQLSEADAAKVLQHTSLKRTDSDPHLSFESRGARHLDPSELPTIDAGDVDRRLAGCGALPPAILQAITLWKGEMVSNAELLELVKKDLEYLKHSVLHEAEKLEKLNENSAFWGRFAFGERWAEKKSRIAATSPEGSDPGWDLLGVIVKANDDLRQEAFVMQLILLCQEAFELAGLELWVSPYRILATGRTTGVIEMVRNAMSFDALKKRPGYGKGGLREHLQRMTEFTADPGGAFKSAQQNFVRSLAAYSLMSYFFLFKDRHNGNILLDTAGHVIHIDFGFVFGVAPGGSFSLEMSTPFKLTEDMINVMGGLTSPLFSEFVTLFCCGFLAIQAHAGTFLTVAEIMCEGSTFKCFDGRDTEDIMTKLRERFCLDQSKEETVAFALDLIKQATTSYGTRQYDVFLYLSQGIAS